MTFVTTSSATMIAIIFPIERGGTYVPAPEPSVPPAADDDIKTVLLPDPALKGVHPPLRFRKRGGPRCAQSSVRSSARIAETRMPEIRKDYATPTWVVFSAARSQRPGGLPELEGCDVEGALPVLRGPRDHDATGSPRVSGRREAGRTRLVD